MGLAVPAPLLLALWSGPLLAWSAPGRVAEGSCEAGGEPDAASMLQKRGSSEKAPRAALHARQEPAGGAACGAPYPLIFDNDANYDDLLGFLYIAKSPLFDLKAITVEATGMSTPSGGPPNMASVAAFLGLGDVPVAYGLTESLSPIATMPLQWRIEVDEFIESLHPGGPNGTVLQPTSDMISDLSAPALIVEVLKSSECPVIVLTTGPVTNLAAALELDPSVVPKIKDVFMMGSAYGVEGGEEGANNVYDWQMEYNGVKGSCAEVGSQIYTGDDPPLKYDGGVGIVRPICRGVSMTEKGNTEWNLFMDVLAWHKVYGFLADSDAGVYVLAANATLNMPINLAEVEAAAESLADPKLSIFTTQLAKAFLAAGEAKWWDAQCIVMMEEVVSQFDLTGGGVCAGWARQKKTSVSLVWKSVLGPDEKEPYGSIKDDPEAKAPLVDYCIFGNAGRMWDVYWSTINKTSAGD